MEISEFERGHIQIKEGDRLLNIEGEMLLLPGDKIGFVLYSGTIDHWIGPQGETPLAEEERASVLAFLQYEFARKGRKIDIVE